MEEKLEDVKVIEDIIEEAELEEICAVNYMTCDVN